MGVVPRSSDASPLVPHVDAVALAGGGALARAAWNTAMVLEDPAAFAHNGPLVRRILDEAERLCP